MHRNSNRDDAHSEASLCRQKELTRHFCAIGSEPQIVARGKVSALLLSRVCGRDIIHVAKNSF